MSLFPKLCVGNPVQKNVDLSIVIAHRGDALGLWATIHSCEIDLRGSSFSYGYVIITNGEKKLSTDTQRTLDFLKKAGKLHYHYHSEEPLSPPTARDIGAMAATGDILFFFDNHCLVGRDYFKIAMQDFKECPEMDMLHSTTYFYAGEDTCYEYCLNLEVNFWATAKFTPQKEGYYRIAAGGHGGFAVRRSVWYEVGGYWDGFVGYGGEEIYFDLKMAMMDKTNYIDTRVIHYHYPGQRGYARHYTDDYYRNMMMCANVIGGEQWMHTVFNSFNRSSKPMTVNMFELLHDASKKSKAHAEWIKSVSRRSLDEQLQYFKEHGISY